MNVHCTSIVAMLLLFTALVACADTSSALHKSLDCTTATFNVTVPGDRINVWKTDPKTGMQYIPSADEVYFAWDRFTAAISYCTAQKPFSLYVQNTVSLSVTTLKTVKDNAGFYYIPVGTMGAGKYIACVLDASGEAGGCSDPFNFGNPSGPSGRGIRLWWVILGAVVAIVTAAYPIPTVMALIAVLPLLCVCVVLVLICQGRKKSTKKEQYQLLSETPTASRRRQYSDATVNFVSPSYISSPY
ncbi:hypothetical protein J8273_8416 [Carpediemonas membranifera]|uniref:Uncharacterized protein n=1 Tax=Carpediemonas membranifera TaxID=201153 RepID=A0A8J6B4A9_9EUKA|nr:hypothetical protein J8273_8416 [Carpediemonas membranifera]|eukprot:KAG9389742.1 hypothetical protein J8273_8416 [Carpediemonas membranifera]